MAFKDPAASKASFPSFWPRYYYYYCYYTSLYMCVCVFRTGNNKTAKDKYVLPICDRGANHRPLCLDLPLITLAVC